MFFETNYLETPNVDQLAPFRISQKQIPARFGAQCRTSHAQLKQAGFGGSRVYYIDNHSSVTRLILWYRHRSGRALVQLQIWEVGPDDFCESLTIVSAMKDDSFALTSNSGAEQFPTASVRIAQYIGGSVEQLLHRHKLKFDLQQTTLVGTNEAVEQIAESLLSEMVATLVEENVFEPREENAVLAGIASDDFGEEVIPLGEIIEDDSDLQVAEFASPLTSASPSAYANSEIASAKASSYPTAQPKLSERHKSVLMEIEAIQNKTSSPLSSLLLLVVSIALFVGAGFLAWNVRFILFLIPILLVHELGHFVAMRVFKYKNVKMFFIPLLGAAVSGRSFNVDGWKKVLVSLAGPLPGLILATPMAIASIYFDSPLLREATLLTVVLNAFNLLPLVPLDGGWVMHSLFFCRHPWLDAVFRIGAGVILILGAVLLGSIFLGLFGLFMMLAIPLIFQNSKIAQALKERHVPLDSNDEQTIPESTAIMIIDELPQTGAQANPKNTAQATLQIFEILNTRPPGLLTSVGLSALYLLSWLAGAIALGILGFSQFANNRMADFLGESTPTIAVVAEEIQRTNEVDLSDAEDAETIVCEFEDKAAADSHFQQLSASKLPVALMGKTIWTTFDTDDRMDFADQIFEIEDLAKKSYPQKAGETTWVSVNCKTPDDEAFAQELMGKLKVYLENGDKYLVAPWSPEFSPTPEMVAARETMRRWLEIDTTTIEDPRISKLNDEITELYEGENDPDEMKLTKLYAEREKVWDEVRNKRIQAIKDDPTMVQEVVELQMANEADVASDDWSDEDWEEYDEQETARGLRLGKLMGQLPLDPATNQPSIHDSRFQGESGLSSLTESRLSLRAISFSQPIDGLPALIKWLAEQGCSDFEFRVGDALSLMSWSGEGDDE